MRAKNGTINRKRHKKVLKATKGYRMTKGRLYKVSKEAQLHADQYAYAGRKIKKRNLRRLWIQRINAHLKQQEVNYNEFFNRLKKANIQLNRKMLADMVISDPETFNKIVKKLFPSAEEKE